MLGIRIFGSVLGIGILSHFVVLSIFWFNVFDIFDRHSFGQLFLKGNLVLERLLLLSEVDRETLADDALVFVVHGLVHGNVHLFDQDAVGWDAVSLLNMDDVANNQMAQFDGLSGSEGTSIHRDFLFVDLILEAQELLVLAVVANRGNDGLGKET